MGERRSTPTIAAALAGKRAELARLADSLQVDGTRIRRELGWRPSFSLAQGLDLTANWYLDQTRTPGNE